MTPAASWERMPLAMRRTMWAISIVPPVLTLPGVLLLEWYLSGPSSEALAAFVTWFAAESLLTGLLAVRFIRLSKGITPVRAPPSAQERRDTLVGAARYGAAFLVFGVVYLAAIYAVVFGLWPLHESSELGAIALNLILLAVLIGVPVVFFYGARALGLLPQGRMWQVGNSSRQRRSERP